MRTPSGADEDPGRDDVPGGGPRDGERDDDEALSWGDESDASHVDGPQASSSQGGDDDGEAVDDGPAVMGSGALVAHGVLGGAALLSAVGWLVSADAFAFVFADRVTTALWRLGVGLAVLAPVLWFASAVVLVPVERVRRRLLVLAVGALVLAPWPFVLGAAS